MALLLSQRRQDKYGINGVDTSKKGSTASELGERKVLSFLNYDILIINMYNAIRYIIT